MNRIQLALILKDLRKKMVFLAGPRQVGKTFIAKEIVKEFERPIYLNYDQIEDRNIIHAQNWPLSTDFICFDELHKMDGWKNYLKGLYDTKPTTMSILVTGSARLEIFSQMGDSLAGRYYLHRLFPLSLAELKQLKIKAELNQLIQRSGFPEPFLALNEIEVDRWRWQYTTSMITRDVFEIDNIKNINDLRTLFELLRTKVGSPLSYQSLAQDLSISPITVKKYIKILEALYVIFCITPYSKNIARSLLKEPKIYFFDTGLVKGDEGVLVENFVAISLLKHVYAKTDYLGQDYKLHYLRTKEKHEVDFAIVNDDIVEQMIEVKNTDATLSKSLYDFKNKYNIPAFQLVKELRHEKIIQGISILRVATFLEQLML